MDLGNSTVNKEKIVSSVSWQMANKVCSVGMNIVVQIILTRLIIPEDFGSFAILNALIGTANIFVESGISIALIQKRELDGGDIFSSQIIGIIVAVFFCSALILCSYPIASYYNMPNLVRPLCVISINLIFHSVNSVFCALLLREMEFKKLFFRTVSVLPLSGTVGIFLAYKGYGLWALVFWQLSLSVLNSIVFVWFSRSKVAFRFSWQKVKDIYSFGMKVLLSGIINGLYDTIRTLAIGANYSKTAIAYFDRANTYSKYSTQIVTATVSNVILPLFSRQQDSIETLKRTARKTAGFSAFVMFPILTGLVAISRPLIILLLTETWEMSIPYFIIFCVLRMPGVVTEIDTQTFYAIGRSDMILKYSILFCVLNMITLRFVLPYGLTAIAVNTLFIEFVVSIFIFVMSSKLIGYKIREKIQDLWRPVLNSILVFVFETILCKMVDFNNLYFQLIAQITIGTGVYITMAFLTKDPNIKLVKALLSSKLKKRKAND